MTDVLAELGGRLELDAHAHVFERTLRASKGSRYLPDYSAPLAEWIAHLRRNDMTGGTLVQPSFLGTDNQQMLRAVEGARAVGLAVTGSAVVAPDVTEDHLQHLADRNVVSLRLNWVGKSFPHDAVAISTQLAGRAARAGLAVELHLEAERSPPICHAIIAQGATLILDHYGLAENDVQLLKLLEDCGHGSSVFIKASAAYRLPAEHSRQIQLATLLLDVAAQMIRRDRILWGTDWPHTRYERTTSFAAAVHLNKRLHESLAERAL